MSEENLFNNELSCRFSLAPLGAVHGSLVIKCGLGVCLRLSARSAGDLMGFFVQID